MQSSTSVTEALTGVQWKHRENTSETQEEHKVWNLALELGNGLRAQTPSAGLTILGSPATVFRPRAIVLLLDEAYEQGTESIWHVAEL
jgi:hypothetical protein